MPSPATLPRRPTIRDFAAASLQRIAGFDEPGSRALARLAERAHPRHLTDEQAVIRDGEAGGSVHLVCEGVLKVFSSDAEGGVALTALALAGDLVGEAAGAAGRGTAVVSSGMSLVLRLGPPAAIAEVLGAENMLRLLSAATSAKLRDLTALHQVIVCRDSVETIRAITRSIVSRSLRFDSAVRPIELSLTQKDLSQMTGYSRETVNRAFRMIYRDSIQFSGSRMRVSAEVVARVLERGGED